MALSKLLVRKYPWNSQKSLFRFSAAATLVWYSGKISSSSKSCSYISLNVLKISSWWMLLYHPCSRVIPAFRNLIAFWQTDKSFGIKREASWSVLLTGWRRWSISSLIASKITFYVSHIILITFKFWLNFLYLSIVLMKDLLQNPVKIRRLLIWEFNAADWCSTQQLLLGCL